MLEMEDGDTLPDMTMKSIVSDAFSYLDDQSCNKDVLIFIRGVEGDKVKYEIVNEKDHPVHEIALNRFTNETLRDIGERHIISKREAMEESGFKSIISRFTEEDTRPKGVIGKAKSVLANFFNKLRIEFKFVDKLWESVTKESKKELNWNLTVLSEVCGVPPVTGITMRQALKYMAKILGRERAETADPVLAERMENAAKLAKDIEDLRKNFSASSFKKVVSQLEETIEKLDTSKILIPIGYSSDGILNEVLLEVSKDPNGSYNLAFISGSNELRHLFDREVGVEGGEMAPRREITGVNKESLLAAIPIFVELQTLPKCLNKKDPTPWREVFMQNMKFGGSWIAAGKVEEKFRSGLSMGHLAETIIYSKGEKAGSEEAKRVDLALRLRIFLDVCKDNDKGFKDQEFRTLVRTTALELAALIEEEKKLLGPQQMQNQEMAHIYIELQTLIDQIEITIPELIDLKKKVLPLFTGSIELEPTKRMPPFIPAVAQPNVFPKVEPSFESCDLSAPLTSIANWALRCRALMDQGHDEQAAQEAKLMVRMFPEPTNPIWKSVNQTLAPDVLEQLATIGEAITRGCYAKEKSSLHDITTIIALNYYASGVANGAFPFTPVIDRKESTIMEAMNQLVQTRQTSYDIHWLKSVRSFPIGNVIDLMRADPKNYQSLFDLTHMAYIALGLYECSSNQLPVGKLTFEGGWGRPVSLKGDPNWKCEINPEIKDPLTDYGPEYTSTVSKELENRYLSEFCCLGCIRDNCPNYNAVDKRQHRFHPLFMLHNYVDIFCPKLTGNGGLYRDEVSDLMYTQQTNQNANKLWGGVHWQRHGFDHAIGFNQNDRIAQLMNTASLYLDKPHFFKRPDLRWHFELKLFGNNAFGSLLGADFKTYQPFIHDMLKNIAKEINVSYAAGDKEVAAYLISVADHLDDLIHSSSLDIADKQGLRKLIKFNADEILLKMVRELISRDDTHVENQQKVAIPVFLERYYKKICQNPNDPALDNIQVLEVIAAALGKVESLNGKDKIDPEFRERYQSMMQWIHPKIESYLQTEKNKGEFANKILLMLNPDIAAKRLQWEPTDYPTLLALDESGEFYEFDLSTGKISLGKAVLQGLPDKYLNDENLIRIFGDAVNGLWQRMEIPSGFDTDALRAYRHVDFPDYRIVIRREAETNRHVAHIQRVIEKTWFDYKRFDEQNRLFEDGEASSTPDIPSEVVVAIGNRACWINTVKQVMYVYDNDGLTQHAAIKLSKTKEGDFEIEDVHLTQDDLHLLKFEDADVKSYSSIEDPAAIQVLGRKGRPLFVSYPRYELANKGVPISYELGKKEVVSPVFPGYRLEAVGVRPGSSDPAFGVLPLPRIFDGYQLLSKGAEQKVLVPLRGFEAVYSARGEMLPLTKTVYPKTFTKCPIYEFSIDPETNRLVAPTGDAYAYLAYLNLAHRDYASAVYYLEKATTCAGYVSNYETISDLMDQWNDDSPNGIALKLKFELFHEKILEDRKLRQIAQGKLEKVGEVTFNQTNRLIRIADLYEKYLAQSTLGLEGEAGIDPSLAVTPNDEFYIKTKIRELLNERGAEVADTGEPDPLRAAPIRRQKYISGEDLDGFDLNRAAVWVWAYSGNSKDESPILFKDRRWVLKNFSTIFNQIIQYKVDSVEFKELCTRLRLINERAQDKISDEEFAATQQALTVLLKLASVKIREPALLIDIKQLMGSEKLPRIKGSLLNFSRVNEVERMIAAQEHIDKFMLNVKSRALTGAEKMIDYKAEKDPYDIKGLGRRAYNYVRKFVGNDKEFKAQFKPFLMREIFGNSGARSINVLSDVFNVLAKVEMEQPKETLQPAIAKPVAKQTYQEKYGKLLEASVESKDQISMLEKLLETKTAKKVASTGAKTEDLPTVIKEEKVKDLLSHCRVIPLEKAKVDEKLFDELKKDPEPAFVRVAEENRADMKAYADDNKQVVISKNDASKLHEKLSGDLEETRRECEELRKQLLQQVDLFNTPAGIIAMRRLAGQGIKPSLEYLIQLWRRGELAQEWDQHPFKKLGLKQMSKPVLERLDKDITRYLELNTKVGHLERLIALDESYIDSCGSKDQGDEIMAAEIYDSIGTKRQFATTGNDEFRDYLFLEYSQNIILRRPQIETLRDMQSDPNAVRQLIMGGGKSKVLLPMLAKRKATGDNLVMLMLPEELYETNCRDLDNTNRQLFGQEMFRFNYSRTTDNSVGGLNEIYRKMLKTINDQGFVMTTKRSMLSFRNSYLDLMYKLQDPNVLDFEKKQIIGQLRAMSKIMKLFNERTDVIADEVDACLDVRKEVNFSLGKAEQADQFKVTIGAEIMQMLLGANKDEPLYELANALIQNTQAAISPDRREVLLKQLALEFYDKNKFAGIDRELFAAYIMDESKGKPVEDSVFRLKEANNDLFKRITAFKGFISRGFGTTLGRIGNVNYGRDPVSGAWTIPYMASNTPHVGSEFDDDVERICFTYQDYL